MYINLSHKSTFRVFFLARLDLHVLLISFNYMFIVFYSMGAKTIQWGKGQSFQHMTLENCISACRRMKLGPCLTPYTKSNSKSIKDLNARAKSVQFLEENIGEHLHDMGFSSESLDVTPKAEKQKKKQINLSS